MNRDLEYYINQRKNEQCAFSPSRKNEVLFINKYLSEFITDDERQLARDNLGVTEQLELLKTLIDTKVFETSDVAWDLQPTLGHTQHILSSDTLYKQFRKYYKKEEIDLSLQTLWQEIMSQLSLDDELSLTSEHPVQNKVITEEIKTLQKKLIPGTSIKNIAGISLLGSGNISFKTIGGDSIIGEGDIDVPTPQLKTINGNSLIGEGNINISGTGGGITAEDLNGLLKTINGRSIVGTGNILIEGYGSGGSYATMEDLQNYVTKEEFQNSGGYLTYDDLYNYMNPLKVTATISPSLAEFTGDNISVTITVTAKKGNTTVNPESRILTYPGNSYTQVMDSSSITLEVNQKGTSKFTVTCTYRGETASAQVTTNQVDATYIGFSSASEAQNVVLSNLNKKILSNISMTQNLQNQVEGNYLWIVSPYTLNMVATDPGFTFRVSMEPAVTLNGLKYYRSSSQLDISNITYYIK